FIQAQQQGIPLALLTSTGDIPRLDSFGLDPNATARMAAALQAGHFVVVPRGAVTINGEPTIGWLEVDPNSGFTTDVRPDGGHDVSLTYTLLKRFIIRFLPGFFFGFGVGILPAALGALQSVIGNVGAFAAKASVAGAMA